MLTIKTYFSINTMSLELNVGKCCSSYFVTNVFEKENIKYILLFCMAYWSAFFQQTKVAFSLIIRFPLSSITLDRGCIAVFRIFESLLKKTLNLNVDLLVPSNKSTFKFRKMRIKIYSTYMVHYARWLLMYLKDTILLQQTHPRLAVEFCNKKTCSQI